MKIRGDIVREPYDGDSMLEVPSEKVTLLLSRPLIDLNLFIGFLESKKPECIDEFIQALVKRLKCLTLDSASMADFDYESQHLSRYPELEVIAKQVILGMLNYTQYEKDLKGESCKILYHDFVKSYVPANNRTVTALVDVIERNEALTLYKDYVDYRTDFFNELLIPKFESLEVLFEGMGKRGGGPQGAVSAILEGGMVVSRVNRCMWVDIQREFGDMEIAYVTACHFDFYAVTLWNEDFELTRMKTCMQDNGYCDFCWHDKRYDKEMKHPPKEFWKSLE